MNTNIKLVKIIIMTLILLSVVIFTGCFEGKAPADYNIENVKSSSKDYFVSVGAIDDYFFFYDKYTKVMYVRYESVYESAMTVLFNADGTVMTYDDWLELE